MTDFEARVVEYIIEARERMTRIEEDLKEHKEGVIQNRTRIVALEIKEEKVEDEVKKLKAPSDTKVTLVTLKRWGAWLITTSAAAKIVHDIFNN